ncbi:female-specific protein transformer-like [Hylaeus volcanicus]|uniref:female-specific protein transformer-like n=1 Tax=Hylaeus volcanicus TaxID=313075 RepID=UPI0023B7CFFA|nr:female-specific protein transformer-like [Hylaeus volcanicus]XP_053991405.1 female-specific protein transformer-like [Hylaeus volcanicus]
MKRSISRHSHSAERSTSSCHENYNTSLRSRTEEERLQRRREWRIQQELQRKHEIMKQKMILEYERRRAREKGLLLPNQEFSCRSRSKSKSKSPHSRHRRRSTSNTSKPSILSEKLESSEGSTPLFKGPEGTKISTTELRKIKVDIHRKIPGKSTPCELQRDIVNPEDVVLKRRAGEGAKPIFEREEIKGTTLVTEEIEEHRTVVTVNNEALENKSSAFKRRSASLSSVRTRSHSPRRTISRHSRHEDSKYGDKGGHRSDRGKNRSRDESREYKEKDRRRTQSHNVEEDHSREKRRSHRDHSRSRERESKRWDRDFHYRDERSYREYRGRSRERSRERRDRDRERRVPPQHYIEQIPVPIYYGNFPPRPIMVGPLVQIRGQGPLGSNRHPPMMGPLRPFGPRFIPADMYRLRPPLNPRFGPMF